MQLVTRRQGVVASNAVGAAALGYLVFLASSSFAAWGQPVTAPSSRFGYECPSGGWAEHHASHIFYNIPVYCPRSYNDYRANHSHGPVHATGFLTNDGSFVGVYDETGNVFASSDIAVRLDPNHTWANTNEDQGFVDMWIYRNPVGHIVRDKRDVRHYRESPNCSGSAYLNPAYFAHEFKTAPHVEDKCAPQALRRTKEPAVASVYGGIYSTTYVTWLERNQQMYNTTPAMYDRSWKVYVAAFAQQTLAGQQQDPIFLEGGLPYGGALNRDGALDAHSPKIAVVAGTPWVIWSEDNGPDWRDTHVKAWENNTWTDKGYYWSTGEAKNCHTGTGGPESTYYNPSTGYSVDIAAVNTFAGEAPVIVSASEVSGECRPVVRMFQGGTWWQVGAAGAMYPGEPSGLIGNGTGASAPRIVATSNGDVFVGWREGSNVRVSTANVALGAVGAAWKDLTGPYSGGHWGEGGFPSLAVNKPSANETNWYQFRVASYKSSSFTVSVETAAVGMVTNTGGYAQKAIWQTPQASANDTTDGQNKPMTLPNAWWAPSTLIPTTVGQVGNWDNYFIFVQSGNGHRMNDTGVFIRKGY
jgi:hypothetical protein